MMTRCEFCGATDDMDYMYEGSAISDNGNMTTVMLCERCANNHDHGLVEVVAMSELRKNFN